MSWVLLPEPLGLGGLVTLWVAQGRGKSLSQEDGVRLMAWA